MNGLDTLHISKDGSFDIVEAILQKINYQYRIETVLDSLITSVESGLTIGRSHKDTLLSDLPHLLHDITLGLEYTKEDFETLIESIVDTSAAIYEIVLKIKEAKFTSFYVFKVTNEFIIIKAK